MSTIGGYQGIIWPIIGLFISGYQSFKLESALIKSLYTRKSKKRRQLKCEVNQVVDNIHNKEAFKLTLYERVKMILVSNLCCCFKKLKWYKRHKKHNNRFSNLQKRLTEEIDILKFIQSYRVGKLIARVTLDEY